MSTKRSERIVQCEVCSATIVVRGQQHRRHCGPICRIRAGRDSREDWYAVEQFVLATPSTAAIHLVAHALMGRHYGCVISAVGITETERLIGATTFSRSHWVRSYEDSPTQQVAVHLAGYVAERLAGGYEARDYAVSKVLNVPEEMQYVRPEPDAWSAYLIASRVDDGYERLELAANWAYTFLRRAWPQISDVSEALVERGGLSGRDIESMVTRPADR